MNLVPFTLAVGVLIIYGTLQFYCVLHPAPNLDLVSARVQDVFIIVISYYFGSSHKPKKKGS